MKLIDKLLKISPSGMLELIQALLTFDDFVPNSHIRKMYNKNAYKVDSELASLVKAGIVLKKEGISKVGRNKAERYFNKYKIDKRNKIVKLLCEEI